MAGKGANGRLPIGMDELCLQLANSDRDDNWASYSEYWELVCSISDIWVDYGEVCSTIYARNRICPSIT